MTGHRDPGVQALGVKDGTSASLLAAFQGNFLGKEFGAAMELGVLGVPEQGGHTQKWAGSERGSEGSEIWDQQ